MDNKAYEKSKGKVDIYLNKGHIEEALVGYKDLLSKNNLSVMQGESINRIIKKATDFLNLHNSGLEKRSFLAILSIGSLIGALFFFSFSITGNAIGNLDLDNSNLIGLILFAFGLIFSLLYFKSKK